MLAEKILAFKKFDLNEENLNIENLKKGGFVFNNGRFGDSKLQNCKIVLKDVKDSKRMN